VEESVGKETHRAPNALDEDYDKWANGFNAHRTQTLENMERILSDKK
jgi:hypothetical protein